MEQRKSVREPFRILALDGGGIKGTFTASVLTAWESDLKQRIPGSRIQDHFDLIAGTSTGGILAIGLGLGLSASEMLEFYKTYGPAIFPNETFAQKVTLAFSHLWRPKYSQKPLRDALTKVFGSKRLGDSTCRLLIPTYDALRGRIFLMKTAHLSRFRYESDASAVEVALSTSAAPTFFKPSDFVAHEGNAYIDGGVWANCPALCAILEAHHFLGVPLENIYVLSVGTTREPTALSHKLERGLFGLLSPGVLQWAPQLISLFFQAQMESSLAISELLLTKARFHRVDLDTPEGVYGLDSSSKIKQLAALGRSRAVEREILGAVENYFLDGTYAEPFVPQYPPSGPESQNP
jgi:patatin-like phospholipase/acyl hydrolase